ncbi:MAG: hypothetical protein LC775_11035 [Acidobacteria bacterium]|nr:hypothetical protein [Acidobacteriota bacterium]
MSKSGSLAIASPPSTTEALTPPCLCIDIETPPSMSNNRFGPAVIHKLAAFRPDSGDKLVVQGAAPALTTELDALTEGAGFVLGHNIWRHDLRSWGRCFRTLNCWHCPSSTRSSSRRSPSRRNPYHRLVKDYKLVSDARSQPLRNAELSLSLFRDELDALRALQRTRPDVALFHSLLVTNCPPISSHETALSWMV